MHATQLHHNPLGVLTLCATDSALTACEFGETTDRDASKPTAASQAVLEETARQLDDYFAGKRTAFDLPLAPRGTEFQRAVWSALEEIPFGETRSYGELARKLGRPTAFRAVGAANGQNPLPIIVPCHRVIGSDGRLVGFGGGLPRKRWLLAHEGADGPLFTRTASG